MAKETYLLQVAGETIPIEIIRSKRKSIGLEVTGEGRARARLPLRLSKQKAEAFLLEHGNWILRKREEIENRKKAHAAHPLAIPPLAELDGSRKAAMLEAFQGKVEAYARKMQVTYGNITIRSQKTRWGSCSGKGNLNFNYRLYFLPEELMDYVIIHELAHRRHMNHSSDFWQEVGRYCPDYEERRKRLKEIVIDGD